MEVTIHLNKDRRETKERPDQRNSPVPVQGMNSPSLAYAPGRRPADVSTTGWHEAGSGVPAQGKIVRLAASDAHAPKPRVLVSDNDETLLTLMTVLLSDEGGYEVLTCHLDGDLHNHILREHPDLVILDLGAGNRVDYGWSVIELLRRAPDTCAIPVILCSVAFYTPAKYANRIEELGVSLLPKPFDIDDLLDMARDALNPQAASFFKARTTERVVVSHPLS